jgi:ubiquinone/menaquinone biosynthesis C-methylase UbiE
MSENSQRDAHLASLSAHAQKNRDMWEMTSDSYQQAHAPDLSGERAMAWGTWRIPEAELHILGEVTNKDVLELGCGAARWSIALAERGARPVGLDVSSRQLQHAHRLMTQAAVDFPLVQASAEDIPLPDASFDIIFCDWGTMAFCDPHRTVAEGARLLRPGGLFAFVTATPIQFLCQDRQTKQLTDYLVNDYFALWRLEWEDQVHFQLPYGQWIRLFRENGLLVEDLIEIQPPREGTSTYRDDAETEWARHWPMEHIWKVRKRTDENI